MTTDRHAQEGMATEQQLKTEQRLQSNGYKAPATEQR